MKRLIGQQYLTLSEELNYQEANSFPRGAILDPFVSQNRYFFIHIEARTGFHEKSAQPLHSKHIKDTSFMDCC